MLAPETLDEIAAAVKAANRHGEPLRIFGSDSKAFYGRRVVGTPLSLRMLSGVIAYEPTELVVTVRAGTRTSDLEALLASEGQMLGCEPPHLGDDHGAAQFSNSPQRLFDHQNAFFSAVALDKLV